MSAEASVAAQPADKIEKREEYMVPLSLIDMNQEDQHRLDRDPEIVEWRTRNMNSIGQTDSIVLAKNSGRFSVVAGFGRVESAKKLGWQKIRAWIFSGSKADAAIHALSSNLLREAINPMEIAIGIDKAIKAGKSLEEVMKEIGRVDKAGNADISWGKQYLDLLTLEPEMQADISKNIMSMDVAKYLHRQEETIRRNLYKAMKAEVGAASVPKEKKTKKEPEKQAANDDDIGLVPISPSDGASAPISPPPLPPAEPAKVSQPKKMTKAVLEKVKKSAGVKSAAKFVGFRECSDYEEHLTNLDAKKFPTDPEEVRKLSLDILNWVRSLRKTYPL
jgi:ParB-like chromosome segregation protein Spo0J